MRSTPISARPRRWSKGRCRPRRARWQIRDQLPIELGGPRSCRRCTNFFAVRDAALAEAAERAGAARDTALTDAGGWLVLPSWRCSACLPASPMMLRRRVIIPLATLLTGVVGDLAAGRHDVTIPTIDRADEIGAMAGSLQVFKDALIAKKAADEAARGGSGRQDPARPARRQDHQRLRSDDRRDRRDRLVGLDRTGSLCRHADGDRGALRAT